MAVCSINDGKKHQCKKAARTCGKVCVSIRDFSLVFMGAPPAGPSHILGCSALDQLAVWLWHVTALFSLASLCVTPHVPLFSQDLCQSNQFPACSTFAHVCMCVCLSVWFMYMSAPLLTCWPHHQMKPCVHSKARLHSAAVSVCPPASPPTTHTSATALPARLTIMSLSFGTIGVGGAEDKEPGGQTPLQRPTSPRSHLVEY